MDSEIQRDGRVLDLTDDAWREDKLPYEDVTIPLVNLVFIKCVQVTVKYRNFYTTFWCVFNGQVFLRDRCYFTLKENVFINEYQLVRTKQSL